MLRIAAALLMASVATVSANDNGRASKGAPVSCKAICTAIELEPGEK